MHACIVAGRAAEQDEIRRRDRAVADLGRERVGGEFERRTRLHGLRSLCKPVVPAAVEA